MKRLLREPLLHFLVVGAILFAVFSLKSGPRAQTERIVVSTGQIQHLAALFERTWMRPPSDEELVGLVDDYVRDEVASREARAMQLDRDDSIVRRRLRQKLEFVASDLVAQVEPSDADLETYLREHAELFAVPGRTTLRQVFFSPERNGDAIERVARDMLAKLAGGALVDDASLGDPSLLPAQLDLATPADIASAFGEEFASAVEPLSIATWSGPIRSTYGVHLVLVTARETKRAPELAEVRDVVAREWTVARKTVLLDEFYRKLRERYEVVIEPLPGAAGDPNRSAAANDGTR